MAAGLRRAVLSALLLAGCTAAAGGQEEPLGAAEEPIADGQVDAGDPAAAAVAPDQLNLCGGVLLAQNAVLTARHCVAPLLYTADDGSIVCGQTEFAEPRAVAAIRVSFDPDIHAAAVSWRAAQTVLVPVSADCCGNDVAVVVLAEPIAAPSPLSPRLNPPPRAGETYAAVGYGGVDDKGDQVGVRRRRDGLSVACAGSACGQGVAASEWEGGPAPCPGDSGGPALDRQGQVIGVVSRGFPQCSGPRYEGIAGNADWLESAVATAAAIGSYPAPAWANVPAPPSAPAPASSSGCTCAAGGDATTGAGAVLFALAFMACRSSRARSTGRSPRRKYPRSSCRSSGR